MNRAACVSVSAIPDSPSIRTPPGGSWLPLFLLFGLLFPVLPVLLSQTYRVIFEPALLAQAPEYECALRSDPDLLSDLIAPGTSAYARLTTASALEVSLSPKTVPLQTSQARAFLIQDGVHKPWSLPLERTAAGSFHSRLPLAQLPELRPGLWTLAFQVTSDRSHGRLRRLLTTLLPPLPETGAPQIYGVLEIHETEAARSR